MVLHIGDVGRTTTPLRPTGEVEIAGDRHTARIESGWLDAGAEVVVIASDSYGLIVRPAVDAMAGKDIPGRGQEIPSITERDEHRERSNQSARDEQFRLDRRRAIRALRDRIAVYAVCALLGSGIGWLLAGQGGVNVALISVTILIFVVEILNEIRV